MSLVEHLNSIMDIHLVNVFTDDKIMLHSEKENNTNFFNHSCTNSVNLKQTHQTRLYLLFRMKQILQVRIVFVFINSSTQGIQTNPELNQKKFYYKIK
ncbi:hypothetical protein BpHYR1_017911 [Brachionus plicatilis]|uniref:Uncharacterized protein n=1 Tax=Brachionus plicatilis TaxID=10195 RepID=A0A3M7SX57_BRAPC|nr:hypothetical protein BpHYR1_017911 [Brachionus plicatilis]